MDSLLLVFDLSKDDHYERVSIWFSKKVIGLYYVDHNVYITNIKKFTIKLISYYCFNITIINELLLGKCLILIDHF